MKSIPGRMRWVGALCLLGPALLVAGCASSRVYRMYAGQPQPNEKIARLIVPNAIDVYSIDGKVVYDFLLKSGASEVQLLPGSRNVVARYNLIWNEGPESHQAVKSGLVGMSFDAQAGHVYRIAFPEPPDLDSAVAFAANVKLWIEDLTPNVSASASSNAPVPPKPTTGGASLAPSATKGPLIPIVTNDRNDVAAPVPDTAATAPRPSAESLPLQNLKFWWQKTDDQDRRQFREWMTTAP